MGCSPTRAVAGAGVQKTRTNIRLMMPRTAADRWVRNALARLPVTQVMGAVQRLMPARGLPAACPSTPRPRRNP